MVADSGIEILDRGDWKVERFEEALKKDLPRLKGGRDTDPLVESSLSRVLDLLEYHVLSLILHGKLDELRHLSTKIKSVREDFPLPRLCDLPLRRRSGAALDFWLGQLRAVEGMPSRRRRAALFDPAGSEAARYRPAMELFFEKPAGLTTEELTVDLRQPAHPILRKLREQGLVISEPTGAIHQHVLSPTGRQFWEEWRTESTPKSEEEEVRADTDNDELLKQLRSSLDRLGEGESELGLIWLLNAGMAVLILEGQFKALGVLAGEIFNIFSRFPNLPMLRDLPLRERVGARLDLSLDQLERISGLQSAEADSGVVVTQLLKGLSNQEPRATMPPQTREVRRAALEKRGLAVGSIDSGQSVREFAHAEDDEAKDRPTLAPPSR